MNTLVQYLKFAITVIGAIATIVGAFILVGFFISYASDDRAKSVFTQTVVPGHTSIKPGDVQSALSHAAATHDWYGMSSAVLDGDRVYSCRPSLPEECVEIKIRAVRGGFEVTATGYSNTLDAPKLAQVGMAMASKDIIDETNQAPR